MSELPTAQGVRFVRLDPLAPPGVAPALAQDAAPAQSPSDWDEEWDEDIEGIAPPRPARRAASRGPGERAHALRSRLAGRIPRLLRPRRWAWGGLAVLLAAAFAIEAGHGEGVAAPTTARSDTARPEPAPKALPLAAAPDPEALALAGHLLALRAQATKSVRPTSAPEIPVRRTATQGAPGAAATAPTQLAGSAATSRPASREIPDEIEAAQSPEGEDPLAELAISGALRWLDPASVPLRARSIIAGPQGPRVRIEGSPGSEARDYGLGDALDGGWKLIAIEAQAITILSPRGNPVRLSLPASAASTREAEHAHP